MAVPSYVTKWPCDFDPDDPTVVTRAAVVDECLTEGGTRARPLHTHPTGQLVLAMGGLVGLQLESGYWSIPAQCAVWVPPGVPHTGVLGLNGKSVFLHIGPERLDGFPKEVVRLMLNPMTVEMILFAAHGSERKRPPEARRHLALATIEEIRLARRLPTHFAPLPQSPHLQRIAMEFSSDEKRFWTMREWADFAGLSERTLARQVRSETGLTFRVWRLQHMLLTSLSQLARDASVEEVAFTAGYQNPSSFISAFRDVFRMTPGEYRRSLQE